MEAKSTRKSKHHDDVLSTKSKHAAHRTVTLKDHHKKPYRKRHFLLLFTSLIVAFGLFGFLISMQTQVQSGLSESRQFVANLFGQSESSSQTITSSYGFSFSYDTKQFTTSAIDGTTGQLYGGSDLATTRAYSTVKLTRGTTQSTPTSTALAKDSDSVLLTYYPDSTAGSTTSLPSLEQKYVAVKAGNAPAPTLASTSTTTSNGIAFQRSVWTQSSNGKLAKNIAAQFITYTGIVNNHAFILRTNNQLATATSDSIDTVIKTLSASAPTLDKQASLNSKAKTSDVAVASTSLTSLLDFSATANAAESTTIDAKELSALYAPSVVKVYNYYCTDIRYKNELVVTDACQGATGSGFFVSSDGYIATNGHVATSNAKDITIYYAFLNLLLGDESVLDALATGANIDLSTFLTIADPTERSSALIDALYKIPEADFKKENNIENMFVGLNHTVPDATKLGTATKDRKAFAASGAIKKATVKAYDYKQFDGLVKYTNSDVALIKVDGDNYPVSRLGSIDSISQGSPLNIIGYPGAASDNELVSTTESEATLTTGKVSSIKKAKGDTRKLIETDTTLGHGNSGGPAYNEQGDVIGIATYTVNGANDSDATYNYIRDVQDLKTLAGKSNITLDQTSKTQFAWDAALKQFNTSHFSAALKNFNTVKTLYAEHPTVDSFIMKSEQNIKDGKDIKEFPMALLLGGVVAALLVAGLAIFLIVRHHGKHKVHTVITGQAFAVPPAGQVAVYSSAPDTPAVIPTTDVAAINNSAPATPTILPEQPITPIDQPQTIDQQLATSQTTVDLQSIESENSLAIDPVASQDQPDYDHEDVIHPEFEEPQAQTTPPQLQTPLPRPSTSIRVQTDEEPRQSNS